MQPADDRGFRVLPPENLPDAEVLDAAPPGGEPAGRLRAVLGRHRVVAVAAAAVLVVAVAAGLAGHRGAGQPRAGSVASGNASAVVVAPPTGVADPGPTGTRRPWPVAAAACGETAMLPLLKTQPGALQTGLRLATGSQHLTTVDLDTGAVSPISAFRPLPGEYVDQLVRAGSDTFVHTVHCTFTAPGRIVRLAADGNSTEIRLAHPVDQLVSDGQQAWGTWSSQDGLGAGVAMSLDGTRTQRLPAMLSVSGVAGNSLVGLLASPGTDAPAEELVLVDLDTGRVRTRLGPAASVYVGPHTLGWLPSVCELDRPCTFLQRDLATGVQTEHRYTLPAGAGVWGATLSPDGRLLALQVTRTQPDPVYDPGHPGNPLDVAVLHLDTGALERVAGLELAPKTLASTAFSPDSQWLVIGLNEGRLIRLLLWRPGLGRTLQAGSPVLGAALYNPPMLLSGGG